MKAVFDTNILIDFLNGIPDAREEIDRFDQRIISVITFIETLVGAKNDEEEAAIRSFLSSFEIKELSKSVANLTVQLRREFRLKIPDAVIYATARDNGCLLVTRDSKDLKEEWPDVRVPYQL